MALDTTLDEGIIEYYKQLQERPNVTDSGIDLVTTSNYMIKPFQTETFNFKIRCQMVKEDESGFYPYYLYPRSSISKTPLVMANSVGIIDRDYRGNIMAKVKNISNPSDDSYHVESGIRLFQICAPDLSPLKLKIVSNLSSTSRGTGGFGSTGTSINSN